MNHVDDCEEWNIHLSMVYLIECEQCQQLKPCELLEDPYIIQIDPDADKLEQYWCKSCYYRRVSEI